MTNEDKQITIEQLLFSGQNFWSVVSQNHLN